jgi:hypothetical protein
MYHLPFFVPLIHSSSFTSLVPLARDLCVAIRHYDIPLSKHIAGNIVLQLGKAIALRFTADLLERAVSPFFSFSKHRLTACNIGAHIGK